MHGIQSSPWWLGADEQWHFCTCILPKVTVKNRRIERRIFSGCESVVHCGRVAVRLHLKRSISNAAFGPPNQQVASARWDGSSGLVRAFFLLLLFSVRAFCDWAQCVCDGRGSKQTLNKQQSTHWPMQIRGQHQTPGSLHSGPCPSYAALQLCVCVVCHSVFGAAVKPGRTRQTPARLYDAMPPTWISCHNDMSAAQHCWWPFLVIFSLLLPP